MARGPTGSWFRYGCIGLVALAVIAVVFIVAIVGIAAVQNRSTLVEHRHLTQQIPNDANHPSHGSLRLRLEIETGGATLTPAPPGEPIRIDADYDPRRYELVHEGAVEGDELVVVVRLRPIGSSALALLRIKLGGDPPMLRIALPQDVMLDIEGRIVTGFTAMELGGLSVTSTRLDVEDGAVKVSFAEPLSAPMESLSIRGSKGSLDVVGLGNASPREARFEQRLGAIDLDLRGPWARDANVVVEGRFAGGSLWLPRNVNVEGLDTSPGLRLGAEPEVPRPTLSVTVSERMGRFVVIE